jgi:hypothetical protein
LENDVSVPVASPFYLAYVADDTVAFDPVAHARMDEYVFSWRRILSETDKPILVLEMRNPHIGILNASRQQWAWLSWLNPANSHIEPLFRGRIVGNPNNVFAEVITVQFVSWPTDYFKRRQNVAETLKVAPFWDEVFIDVNKSDDPDTILEARSELWCVDCITLAVTAEDILDASDGNIDITADQHFYDALDMHDGDAPLTAVLMDATVSWTQTGRGFIDMGQQNISTYGGDGIISEWPKPMTQLGNGWSLQDGFALDSSHTAQMLTGTYSTSYTNKEEEHSDGDTLSINLTVTAPGASTPLIKQVLTWRQQDGLQDPFATDGNGDPAPINIPASYQDSSAYVPLWQVNTSMNLRYDLARQRTERVRIMLTSDLQAIINDPLVTQNSETITMTGRDVGVPIVDLLDWTTIADTNVTVGMVVFPDDPQLPGGRSSQVCVVPGPTGTVEPEFSDIPGTITVDGTAHWSSMGTQNPTEGAQDWTGFTNYNPGAIILPRYPMWAKLADLERSGLLQFPPIGTAISLGQIVQMSDGSFSVCTLDGTTSVTGAPGTVVFASLGNVLPDGKTYYVSPNGGQSGALYITPQFGANTVLHDQVSDNGITWVSIGSGDIPAGGTPGNVWARSYFASTRGTQSLEYLMAIQRAHLRKRARAVEIEFECNFDLGIGITCRKTVTLHDTRIPGGVATGKVTRAELSADGDTGEVKCHVTVGVAVGKGNSVTAVAGTSTYGAPGYAQSGYQQTAGGVVLLPGLSDVGYTPIVAAPDDDGLVLPLDKGQVVITEGIRGSLSLSAQEDAIKSALASMAKAAQLAQTPWAYGFSNSIQGSIDLQQQIILLNANSVALAIQQNPIYYEAQLKPVTNGPFWDAYVVKTQPMTVPQGIDLLGASTP